MWGNSLWRPQEDARREEAFLRPRPSDRLAKPCEWVRPVASACSEPTPWGAVHIGVWGWVTPHKEMRWSKSCFYNLLPNWFFLLLLLLLLHSIMVPTNQQEIIMIYFFFFWKTASSTYRKYLRSICYSQWKIPTETLILPSAHPDLARTELVIYTPLSWTDLLPDVFLLPVKSLPPGHLSVRSPSLLGCKVCCRDPWGPRGGTREVPEPLQTFLVFPEHTNSPYQSPKSDSISHQH